MLALKLLLVPTFLLLLSLAGRRFGPRVSGWLAGLPVVAGPILLFITLENGAAFGAAAARSSTAAVLAAVAFGATYAHAARRVAWPGALALALVAWSLAVCVVALMPASPLWSLAVALGSLALAPAVFPAPAPISAQRDISRTELALRMAAGAGLTVAVSALASRVGSAWSGLLAVFPVLSVVLAVFSHRANGAAFVATLLRAMVTGLYSFVAFCAVLSLALQALPVLPSFSLAIAAAIAAQVSTRKVR